MGFLRGLGTTVCSILLFLTLSVYSTAFLLNGTVLNTDFMNRQIDKMDITGIVHDTVNQQIQQEISQDSDFISGVVDDILVTEEPHIKEQMHSAINQGYDYFLGKTEVFSISVSLVAIKNDIRDNLFQIAKDYLTQKFAAMTDSQVDQYAASIAAQIPSTDLPGVMQVLRQDTQTQIIKEYIKSLGGKGTFNTLFSALNFAVEPAAKQALQQYFDDSTSGIEDTYTVDSSTLDANTMQSLRNVRTSIRYFQLWYAWLIVIMVILAAAIFLINWRNLRTSVRALGIDLLVFGVLDLAGILTLKAVNPQNYIFQHTNVSVSLQNWITGLISDVTGMMLTFTIVVLVVGAALLTASFFIKRPEPAG